MQSGIITRHETISGMKMVKEYLKIRVNVYRASAPHKKAYIYYFIHTTN